jgi:anti-anti-sigma factor
MKYSVSTRKELTILKIEEDVFDFRHSEAFRLTIDRMVNKENIKNLIIDFSQVKAIDSCGISSMLLAHQLSNQSQGLAVFVSLCKQIKDLLKLTNLDKQLYIFSSINEVVTLIEPAMKSKRGVRGKSQTPVDEIIDELLCDDLDLIVEPDLHDEHLDEHLDEQLVEPDEITIEPELPDPKAEKECNLKKRGRPKKTESETTSKSKKNNEKPDA